MVWFSIIIFFGKKGVWYGDVLAIYCFTLLWNIEGNIVVSKIIGKNFKFIESGMIVKH